MNKTTITHDVLSVCKLPLFKLLLLCISALAFSGCASTPSPRAQNSQPGVVSLHRAPTLVPGSSVYTRLSRVGSTWVFGRLTSRHQTPTSRSIFIRLNDLAPMIEAHATSIQVTCGSGAEKCKGASSEEKSLGINYGPFAQLHASDTDVAATIIGNILDAGGLASPVGKPLGIRYSKTLDFNAPAYVAALNSANSMRAYVSNRRNVVEGFNAIRAASRKALASAKFQFVVSRVTDDSGLYRPGSINGLGVGRPLSPTDAAQLAGTMPKSGASVAARYLQDLEQNPATPYSGIVSSMRNAYMTTPVVYDVECGPAEGRFAGFWISVRCPATVNSRPLGNLKPTVVPVSIIIHSRMFANLFPSFIVRNTTLSVAASSNGLSFYNLTDEYESIRNISIYWGREILTRRNVDVTIPPDGKAAYGLSSFAFDPMVYKVTRKQLLTRHVSTGIAVMYRLGGNVRSLYKRIYVDGHALVSEVKSQ